MGEPSVLLDGLDFRYGPGEPLVLRGLHLALHPGDRCLLVGANGAGKTTLLRVLAGLHLVPGERVRVLGRPAFHDPSLAREVAFIGGVFPFRADVAVRELVERLPGARPELVPELVELLGVDPGWRMHRLSDGQRRRVQILAALSRDPRVLLLDEVTTDLDVLARQDLLAWLRRASERGVTLLYATHILDGLEDWASHLAYLARGELRLHRPLAELPGLAELRARGEPSPLARTVAAWLRAERAAARA